MTHPRRLFLLAVLAAVLSVVAVTAIVTHAISPEQVIAGFRALKDMAQLGIVGWLGVKALGAILDYAARVRTTPKVESMPVQRKANMRDEYQVNTRPTKAQRVVV